MRTALRLSLVFAYGLSLHAQVTASLNRFRDRSPEIAIRNDSAMDLTAFAVAMAPAAGGPREIPSSYLSTPQSTPIGQLHIA